jgi:hypothetical protein
MGSKAYGVKSFSHKGTKTLRLRFCGQLFVFLDRIDKIEQDFFTVIYKFWQAPPRQLGLIKKAPEFGVIIIAKYQVITIAQIFRFSVNKSTYI